MSYYLRTKELARRWNCSVRTLEGDRYRGRGCPYLKLSGRVVYALADIEKYEATARRPVGEVA